MSEFTHSVLVSSGLHEVVRVSIGLHEEASYSLCVHVLGMTVNCILQSYICCHHYVGLVFERTQYYLTVPYGYYTCILRGRNIQSYVPSILRPSKYDPKPGQLIILNCDGSEV